MSRGSFLEHHIKKKKKKEEDLTSSLMGPVTIYSFSWDYRTLLISKVMENMYKL